MPSTRQRVAGDGAIPPKYRELVAVAAGLTTQCAYCQDVHVGRTLDAGATYKKLAEVAFVVASLRARAALGHGLTMLCLAESGGLADRAAPGQARPDGSGRALMGDLMRAAETLGVARISIDAERIGRYTWLRASLVPDRASWRTSSWTRLGSPGAGGKTWVTPCRRCWP